MTQKDALAIMKTGANVFITGPAGSGKTYVVNEYIRYLRDHGVPIGITASTGIAATHMGGMTIHSWSGIGIKNFLTDHDLAAIADKSSIRRRIEDTKVLIIDEVSMLHHFRLDMVDRTLKHIKKSELPFGGIQIVLCGDFFQLPPISRMGEPDARFVYNSDSWKQGKFAVCYLSENYRQADDVSVTILNEIRSGEVSDGARELLRTRYVGVSRQTLAEPVEPATSVDFEPDELFSEEGQTKTLRRGEGGLGVVGIEPTRLYTHNIDVDVVNERELRKVAEGEVRYSMGSRGRKSLVEVLKKSCLAPEDLRLKRGARVMCVKNNFDKGYVNGTLGVIFSCAADMDPVIKTSRGETITIERATWQIEEDGKVLAEISQYPLRLAWAITVHKSQGMSLDAIEVDLSKSFEPGMGYVALSRVRTLAGLTILGLNEAALQVHPEVLEYDRHLRALSDKAENYLALRGEKEMSERHAEFLGKVAPLHYVKQVNGKKGKKEKQIKISSIEKTAELIRARKSLSEIMAAREMVADTIIGHIEDLAEEGLISYVPDSQKLDISYLKYDISPQHWDKIAKALEEVAEKQDDDKPPFLSPVKSKVGANISFKEIRLARVLLGYFGAK